MRPMTKAGALVILIAAAAPAQATTAPDSALGPYRAMILSADASDADWQRRGTISARYAETLARGDRRIPIRSVRVRMDSRSRQSQRCAETIRPAYSVRTGSSLEIVFCPVGLRALGALSAVQTLGSISGFDERSGLPVAARDSVRPYLTRLLVRADGLFLPGGGGFREPVFCDPFPFVSGPDPNVPCHPEIDAAMLDVALVRAQSAPLVAQILERRRQMGGSELTPAELVAELLDGRLQLISDFIAAHEIGHYRLGNAPVGDEAELAADAAAADLIISDRENNGYLGVMEPVLSIVQLGALFSDFRPLRPADTVDARISASFCLVRQQLEELVRRSPALAALRRDGPPMVTGAINAMFALVESQCPAVRPR